MSEWEKVKTKLKKLKAMGFVQSKRFHDTGIGKTLEDWLEIKENNIAGPDNTEYELKSERNHSSSMLTMFTKSPLPRGSTTLLREEYGYPSKFNKDPELHATLDSRNFTNLPSGKKLRIACLPDKITIVNHLDETLCGWKKEDLQKAFETKFSKAMLLVKADSRMNAQGKEEFWYKDAIAMKNFGFGGFINALKSGIVKIDLRLGHYDSGKLLGKRHDHGTAFRVKPDKLDLCFGERKQLL